MTRSNGYVKLMEAVAMKQDRMLETLVEQGKTLAVLGQKLTDTHDRLFGDEGAVPRLADSVKNAEVRIDRVSIELAGVNKRVIYLSGIATGLGMALGTWMRHLLQKLGWGV